MAGVTSYFRGIWRSLITAAKGMSISGRHLAREKVTRYYPDPKEAYVLPERARNRLYVNMDDCIGCDKCARACPVNCIEIDTVKTVPGEDLGVTSNGKKKALWVTRFDIDMAKCCFCSLCIWPCPTECIVMTEVFEYAEPRRDNLIYEFAAMDRVEAELHMTNWSVWQIEAQKQREKQAAERALRPASERTDGSGSQGKSASTPSSGKPGSIKPPPFLRNKTSDAADTGKGEAE